VSQVPADVVVHELALAHEMHGPVPSKLYELLHAAVLTAPAPLLSPE